MTTFVPNWMGNLSLVNVRDQGAVGNGVTDDTDAVERALTAAYGSRTSPHGNAGRFLNKPVYFPAGNYRITRPLYLVDVYGAWLFGQGPDATVISFESNGLGNAIVADGITPLFMCNGTAFPIFENMTLGCAATATQTIAIHLIQDGTTSANTTSPLFRNMIIQGFGNGIYSENTYGGNCENGILIGVTFNRCRYSGLRLYGQNVLNWQVYGGAADSCGWGSTWVSSASAGDCGAAYTCLTGGLSPLVGVSFSGNYMDVINTGFGGTSIIGGSSESGGGFIDDPAGVGSRRATLGSIGCVGTHFIISEFAWRPTLSIATGNSIVTGDPTTAVFCDLANGGRVTANGVFLNPGTNNGDAIAFALGSSGKLTLTGAEMAGHSCKITGSSGAEAGIDTITSGGVDPLASFTGQVTKFIGDNNGAKFVNNTTVANLPTAAAKWKGIRGSVTDANATTFLSTVAGGGSNVVPVFCDGTAWKIG